MYVPDMANRMRAWAPELPGVREVLHARFDDHAYPMHSHDAWTVLVVDAGAVRYDLERRAHGTADAHVTLLPPDLPHDGAAATPAGFRKRVLYLERDVLGVERIGAAVDRPGLHDQALGRGLDRLHRALVAGGDPLEASSRRAFIVERLIRHLAPSRSADVSSADPVLARRLRDQLDARVADGIRLDDAAAGLGVTATHLIRAFSREFGIPPHRYLVSRRVDVARRALLNGVAVADAAVAAGFYDQAHLARHFRRVLGVAPSAFGGGRDSASRGR